MQERFAADLARRLAQNAEAVCRHYLSNGSRAGRYWMVGDARNTPGRSMFVRLWGTQEGRGAAGKWTDAATGEHGDLLDVLREACHLHDFRQIAAEAERFLGLSQPIYEPADDERPMSPSFGTSTSARRLFAMSQPLSGTVAEAYLRKRGITFIPGCEIVRFHPRCYYRPDPGSRTEIWPAMIAAVTDLAGNVTGVHRTWLDPSILDKAPVDTPRRSMGRLLGNAVRFGLAQEVMAAGEGIETMLSLKSVLPDMPLLAALSAAHLSAVEFPAVLRRLYVAHDADPAGDRAVAVLVDRAGKLGIEAICLSPQLGDFNEDLSTLGINALRASVRVQLAPQDVARFMPNVPTVGGAARTCGR